MPMVILLQRKMYGTGLILLIQRASEINVITHPSSRWTHHGSEITEALADPKPGRSTPLIPVLTQMYDY